jgi:hypothetical protein
VQIVGSLNGGAALRAAALAVALAVAALATGCNGGTVDSHALKRDAEKVASLATEGELLANDMAKGASTKYFARVHAKELSQAASDLAGNRERRAQALARGREDVAPPRAASAPPHQP